MAIRDIHSVEISNLDLVTLQHFAEAEERGGPSPPAFIDTLVRLAKCGYLQDDPERRFRVTDDGRSFLRDRVEAPYQDSPIASAR